jgi:O-antigen/teichoic acid export membrane protein
MSLLKNVLVVLRGSLIAQGLSFAALPILARVFPPDAFGRYQVFLSVLGFALLAASLRYELAILNAKTDAGAFSLAKLCLVINVIFSILALVLCVPLYVLNPTWVERLGPTLWALPPVLLVAGVFQTLTYLMLRSHAFNEGSTARGLQALGNTSSALGLGWLKITGLGLVVADVIGRAIALLHAGSKMIHKDARYRLWRSDAADLSQLMRDFREYPLVTLPGSLLNGLGGILTPMLMFAAFGTTVSGQYALVERCIATPIAVISQAVAQVFMASFSTALRSDPGECLPLFTKVVRTHLKIAAAPTIILMLFGQQIFTFAFGTRWELAGNFSQSLAPMLLMSFLVAPVDMTLQLLSQQKLNFAWHAFRLTLVLGGWIVIWKCGFTPVLAIRTHAVLTSVAYLLLLYTIYRNVKATANIREPRLT